MKIFGIGLSRTGTKSLTQALRILNYRAAHFEVGARALRIIAGQLVFDFSVLFSWDALSDTPASAFFKDLDQEFPGSKFILTTRDITGWLDGCRRHYAIDRRPYWQQHHIDAEVVFRLNHRLYGVTGFDTDAFRQAYVRHADAVAAHFQNRASDLLVMDIIGGDGWEKLCPFLDRPVPAVEFPHVTNWKKLP